jgi:phosphohistidine phosphatase
MPTLVLLRHAKAEPHRDGDHSRRLAARGRADAGAVREWLLRHQLVPDRVVVSSAARTRETWELASPGGAPPTYDDRVYNAPAQELREVLAQTPAGTEVLVLVGHNPGIERLAWELDDGPAARELTDRGMPTSALAVFEVDGWDLATARLRELAAPRG